MDQALEQYLLQTIKPKNQLIQEMETHANQKDVPIMEPLSIEFLMQLIRIKKPKRILEIGAAIGYSAIRMAQAQQGCHIVTIERDEVRYKHAVDFVDKAGLSDQIDIVFGDVFDKEKELLETGPYDLLFIDAAKGQYQKFFEMFSKVLNKDGIIISDNVLFKGYVAEDIDSSRQQKIGRKLRLFNDWLVDHPDYHTTIMPIGDGVAISVKR